NSFARQGTLEGFDVHIDPRTGTIRVHGIFPNHDRLLLPGMSAWVRVPFGKMLHSAITIPGSVSISMSKDESWVYVVDKSDQIQKRFVKLGPRNADMQVIEEGLSLDDLVIMQRPFD